MDVRGNIQANGTPVQMLVRLIFCFVLHFAIITLRLRGVCSGNGSCDDDTDSFEAVRLVVTTAMEQELRTGY
jgi:hypothetical protein